MMNPIVAVSVFSLEILICYIFFSNIFQRKRSNLICFLCGAIAALLAASCNLLSHNSGVINTIVSTVV